MDTKFSVAVHLLILISESPDPLNSEQIARSVGSNASYIRKVLALLKRQGLVDSRRGISGYALTTAPDRVTLLRIYQAVMEEPAPRLLDIHQNPNDRCVVGRHIQPVLRGMFAEIEGVFSDAMAEKSLADCIAEMKKLSAKKTGQAAAEDRKGQRCSEACGGSGNEKGHAAEKRKQAAFVFCDASAERG